MNTTDENHAHHDHDHGHHSEPKGDHSRPDRFADPRSPWVPGLVEVEFNPSFDSGVLDQDFVNASERRKPSDLWKNEKLLEILRDNQMLAWRPSFPITRPWSKEPVAKAREYFKNSGRNRYVTFRFAEFADVSQIAAELRKLPEIKQATPVAKVVPPAISDPLLVGSDQVQMLGNFQNQWYAFRCNLPQVLKKYTGRDVIVAAIDWGFSESHPDYGAAIELKKNIYKNDESIENGNCGHHGTAVLGLAGARSNGEGMVGFAPDSTLWAIQAGEDEIVDHEHWRDAIDFVRLQPPSSHRKVIILEIQTALGGNVEAIPSINQAIIDAIAAGVVVCVPAGNRAGDAGKDDEGKDIRPTGSVLVGATLYDPKDNFLCSKEGEWIVVYAPGDTYHDVTCINQAINYTNRFGGTSGAVAKVAGAVALMLEANDSLTPAEVRDILKLSQIEVCNASMEKVGVLLDCENAVGHALRGRNQ